MTTNDNMYRELYNDHPEYEKIRSRYGPTYQKYINDVKFWKLKYLNKLLYFLPNIGLNQNKQKIIEIGCSTGILLNLFQVDKFETKKWGIDISDENIKSAKNQFPKINFYNGSLQSFKTSYPNINFDFCILSDILEHVEGDLKLLKESGSISQYVLLNLPIEKVPEYNNREYGIDDIEGHLRAYSVDDALRLCQNANMEIIKYEVKTYVQEPVFRDYLLEKLINNNENKNEAILQYLKELNHIEMNTDYYKKNFFALLKSKY